MVGRSSKADAPTLYGDLTLTDAQRMKRKGDALVRDLCKDPSKARATLRKLGLTHSNGEQTK